MVRVIVIYDSKYGNTKLAAENIIKGISENEGVETAIGYIREIETEKLADFDALVLGAPNHMGRPSRAMKKFVETLADLDLKAKNVAIFDTYAGRERKVDRAVKKLEKIVEKNLPSLQMVLPSLSVRVNGVTGPVVESELPKCVDFGRKIAAQLESV